MSRLTRLAAVASTLFVMTQGDATAQEAVTWNDDVRGWCTGGDRSIGNGCYMHASFEGGIFLGIGFNNVIERFQFVGGDRALRSIEAGKLCPIEVQFGNRSPWSGEANGFRRDDGEASLVLNVDCSEGRLETFVTETQQMQNVVVRYQGQHISNLSLRGSYAGMLEVLTCQRAMFEGRATGVDDTDPFSGASDSGSDPFR